MAPGEGGARPGEGGARVRGDCGVCGRVRWGVEDGECEGGEGG